LSAPLLVDSHVFLWLLEGSRRLEPEVFETLSDGKTSVFVSAVTVAELCIKNALGKLALPDEIEANPAAGFRASLDRMAMTQLPLTIDHAAKLRALPRHHGDPFDRMLIAQALEDGLTIVTHDRMFGLYADLKVLWT
jgi:PIN domain nuclease of toxin-antitoxin system